MADEQQQPYAEWSVLELMGHRRLGGFVREVTIAGAGFFRIGIPGEDGQTTSTQFYPPASLYGLTPVSEEAARIVAKYNRPEPVSRYELPAPPRAMSPYCDRCEERHPPGEHTDADDYDDADEIAEVGSF